MQRPFAGADRERDGKTPRGFWFFERVWNFGVNLAAAVLALIISLPILWVIFKFWQMTLRNLEG